MWSASASGPEGAKAGGVVTSGDGRGSSSVIGSGEASEDAGEEGSGKIDGE